jgi:hypothetical protein
LKDYGPGLVSDFTVLKDFGEVIPSVIKEQQSSIGLMQYDIRGKHLHQDSLKGQCIEYETIKKVRKLAFLVL